MKQSLHFDEIVEGLKPQAQARCWAQHGAQHGTAFCFAKDVGLVPINCEFFFVAETCTIDHESKQQKTENKGLFLVFFWIYDRIVL